jgi:hypothetical protein
VNSFAGDAVDASASATFEGVELTVDFHPSGAVGGLAVEGVWILSFGDFQ